jgi:multidrug efflux pump subunit AcrA (membrane-fusion protein)
LIAVALSSLVCANNAGAQDHDHHDKDPFSNGEPHGGAGDGIKLTDQGKTAIGIEVRNAERRALPGRIVTTGKLESIPTQEYVQHAPIAGRVEQVFVQPGQYVQPGQTLLSLSSPELQQLGAQLLQEKTQIEAEVTAKKRNWTVMFRRKHKEIYQDNLQARVAALRERIGSQKSMQQAKRLELGNRSL